MNLFEKLSNEHKQMILDWDVEFLLEYNRFNSGMRKTLEKKDSILQLDITDWALLKSILNYDTIDDTYINTFNN